MRCRQVKILREDRKHGVTKVYVETLNDLWTLYNVIEEGDLIQCRTTREIKMERIGRPSSKRVPMNILLKVQKIYFDRELNRLRIHGIIEDGPEEYSVKGLHHTLNVETTTALTIKKSYWFGYQINSLKKAVQEEKPFLTVSLDAEDACVALLRNFRVEVRSEIRSRVPGKRSSELREEAIKKYFSEVAKNMQTIIDKVDAKIIVVGPGFTKNAFDQYLKEKHAKLAEKVIAVKSAGSGGVSGVFESLRSGILRGVSDKIRISEEIMLMEEVLSKMGRNSGDVSYGLEEVGEEAMIGSIHTLLVSLELLKKSSEEERKRIEEGIRMVEKKRGRVFIINPDHEGGKKLKSLGGIAAILRYSKHYR